MECLLCHKNFNSLTGLHGHLSRTHKCSQPEYYHTFFGRYDKHTNELIRYKDHKQYFATDFNDRESFSNWLADNYSLDSTKKYCLDRARERAVRKGFFLLPSQACLKTIFLPSVLGWERIFCGTENVKRALAAEGISLRFDYAIKPTFKAGELCVLQDTREQQPLNFKNKKIVKLSVGDYTAEGDFYKNLYVERKSLNDLASTLGNGYERFVAELEKAETLGLYVVIVVEDTLTEILNYSPKSSFGKRANGQHLAHQVRDLSDKFQNIQWVFAGSRVRAVDLIEKIFRINEDVQKIDFEYLKDGGIL